jgi:hypothetical protein
MIRKTLLSLALGASTLSLPLPLLAQSSEAGAVDPARLKLAEQVVGKLIPPGSYQKMMKDMADQMADGMIQQMMGMDAAIMAKAGGVDAKDVEGKSLGELASVADPHFKERIDITMKVMFGEMGTLMNAMEPAARSALAKVYARKYDVRQLGDMNAFFATTSGATFASDFFATFTDKEMMNAMMGEMPKLIEAMPAIMKKVEAATAHLPPLPKNEAAQADVEETKDISSGIEPWLDPENWDAADLKKYEALTKKIEASSKQFSKMTEELSRISDASVKKSKARYLVQGWKEPVPELNIFNEQDRAKLRESWSQEDKEALAILEAQNAAAEAAAAKATTNYNRIDEMLWAGYAQAMVNAGQDEGVKRPAKEAAEDAGRRYDATRSEEPKAEIHSAKPE